MEDEEIEPILNEVIQRFLLPKFRELGMPATGEWEQNIEARGSSIWGRSYTEQLVDGREPGRMPPVDALIPWVEAKLGYSGNQARSVAWAVSKKIAEEGTTWYQRGGSDLLEVLESNEVRDFLVDQIGIILRAKVTLRFERELREA